MSPGEYVEVRRVERAVHTSKSE